MPSVLAAARSVLTRAAADKVISRGYWVYRDDFTDIVSWHNIPDPSERVAVVYCWPSRSWRRPTTAAPD